MPLLKPRYLIGKSVRQACVRAQSRLVEAGELFAFHLNYVLPNDSLAMNVDMKEVIK